MFIREPQSVVDRFVTTIQVERALPALGVSLIAAIVALVLLQSLTRGKRFLGNVYQDLIDEDDDGSDDPTLPGQKPKALTYASAMEMARGQAEQVMERQLNDLEDIDDASVRTLRINIILLGALASFGQAGTSFLDLTQFHTALGMTLIAVSTAFAILTYHISDPQFGLGPEYIEKIVDSQSDVRYWKADLALAYADWIEENEEINSRNGAYLIICHLALVLGLSLILFGIQQTIANTGGAALS
jgi:hypothetical protein